MSKKINVSEELLDISGTATERKRLYEKNHCLPTASSKYIDIQSNGSGSGSSDLTDVSDAEEGTPMKVIKCKIKDSSSISDDGFEEISEDSTTDDEEPIQRKKKLFERLLLWAKRALRPRNRPF